MQPEIIKEALRWVYENKQTKDATPTYTSPRLSSEMMDCSMPMTFDSLSRCYYGCLYCLDLRTPIYGPDYNRGKTFLQHVKEGDTVWSYNTETQQLEKDSITAVMRKTVTEYYEIDTDNGHTITITGEHPVYVKDKGWVLAEELIVGDQVLRVQPLLQRVKDAHTTITAIRKVQKSLRVGNIETSKNNNYFAGSGILVHNCFAYFQKAYKNELTGRVYPLAQVNMTRMENMITGLGKNKSDIPFYEHFFKKRFLLHWGGMADPFCAFEKKIGVTQKLLTLLGEKAYPTLLSFKGDTVFDEDYLRIFDNYAGQSNFAFQVSIITADDDLAKKVEIGVPSPTRRLEALKVLSAMGYWTILRLRPFIIGITDRTLDELLEKALAAGIKAISTEFFTIDYRCTAGTAQRYKWLGDIIGTDNLLKYYTTLSPSTRGGYCRLNRNVKEAHIRKIYTFCQKHGLVLGVSDPDFKELSTSGSCCAMPDTFSKNPEMCNWSTDQFTYHIKRARQIYHTTGEKVILKLDEVFNTEKSTYWDDVRLSNDYVGVIGRNAAERLILTPKLIMQEQWNNLRSGNCPRNYFDGKVVPVGLDEAGNYIFQYNPLEYEQRWVDMGIDLTF